jgi:transposase
MGAAHKRMNPAVAQQVNRAFDVLFIKCMAQAIQKLRSPWQPCRTGRPPHSPRVVVLCCLLKVMTGRTYDEIEAYVECMAEEIQHRFHVSRVPGHSVIHRGMAQVRMRYIRKLNVLLIRAYRQRGMHIAVDSSGFRTSSTSKWFDIRIRRQNIRGDYLKLHIAIDIATGLIQAFSITPGQRHECPEFTRLMHRLPDVGDVMADKGYSSRDNCSIVADKGGTPYIPFKGNATKRMKGSSAWAASYQAYQENTDRWMDTYHKRELVEAVFSSLKQRWNESIASRQRWLRWRELAIKVLVYNTKQLLCYQQAKKNGVDLWTTAR